MKSNYNISFQQGKLGVWSIAQWRPRCQNEHLVVIIPAFAEEMNRTRRPLSALAEELVKIGYTVWIPDFYGTGDAEGDFCQIDLTCWVDDMSKAIESSSFKQISIIACRFGVQVLNAYLQQRLNLQIEISQIVLWQPQWNIHLFWQHIWRLDVVSNLTVNNKIKQSAENRLIERGFVDIQGYKIPRTFFEQTQLLSDPMLVFSKYPVVWFECNQLGNTSASVSMNYQRLKDTSSCQHALYVLPVQSFWLTQETTDVSVLIDATVSVFKRSQNV